MVENRVGGRNGPPVFSVWPGGRSIRSVVPARLVQVHDVTITRVTPFVASNSIGFRQAPLWRGDLWIKSAQILAVLLGNSFLCLFLSGLAIAGCAVGNVFTGRASSEQSYPQFLSGIMMSNMFLFCLTIVLIHSSLLVGKNFLQGGSEGRPASLIVALRRVIYATGHWIILWVATAVGFVFAFDAVTGGRARKIRIDYYMSCLLGWLFITLVWMITRRIYQEETRQGIENTQKQNRQGKRTLILSSAITPVKERRLRWRRLRRVLLRGAPTMGAIVVAGFYGQLTSLWILKTNTDLFFFTTGSLILKVVLQESVKILMMRGRVKDSRTMFLAVGLPTVLIDTQIRLALQLAQSKAMGIGGSIALALLEIIVRWSKVFILRVQIRRREQQSKRSIQRLSGTPTLASRQGGFSASLRRNDSNHPNSEAWKNLALKFHATEVYADMSAEYVAIMCSAMILYVYGRHPKYELLLDRAMTMDVTPTGQFTVDRIIRVLILQVLLELGVDTLSCVLELSEGVNFDELRRHRAYVSVTFFGIGIMNIQISAIMYLRTS